MAQLWECFPGVDAPCGHPNLTPLTYQAGKRTWQGSGYVMDWSSNIINAHEIRVVNYWCPTCGQIIQAPTTMSDE